MELIHGCIKSFNICSHADLLQKESVFTEAGGGWGEQ